MQSAARVMFSKIVSLVLLASYVAIQATAVPHAHAHQAPDHDLRPHTHLSALSIRGATNTTNITAIRIVKMVTSMGIPMGRFSRWNKKFQCMVSMTPRAFMFRLVSA